jgi:hypothetical protein
MFGANWLKPFRAAVREPRPRSRLLAIRVLRGCWTLPTNIVGHLTGIALTRHPPRRVRSDAAEGWFYSLRDLSFGREITALTLGHVILYRPQRLAGTEGRMILAHELAHTRQHDVLGPLYLPLHIAAEVGSVIATSLLGARGERAVHRFNPLEQSFICIPASACRPVAAGDATCPGGTEVYLRLFGLEERAFQALIH